MINPTSTQLEQLESNEVNLRDLTDQPEWLDISDMATIHAVQQGGCESGAYMEAVTYYDAKQTMAEHGDDILEYIASSLGELPSHDRDSWGHICVFYFSVAVELWCGQFDLDGVDWD